MGRYRVSEQGLPIDATGVIFQTTRGDLHFDGAAELVHEHRMESERYEKRLPTEKEEGGDGAYVKTQKD